MKSDENGGVLASALFVLFIAISIGVFIINMTRYLRKSNISEKQNIIHDINLRSCLTQIKSQSSKGIENIDFGIKKTTELNGQKIETTYQPFGLFLSFQLKISSSNHSYNHFGLISNSNQPRGNYKAAFVQLSRNNTFVIAGKSSISGNMYISNNGIQNGAYKGVHYTKELPQNGEVIAKYNLTEFSPEFVNLTIRVCEEHLSINENLLFDFQDNKLELNGKTALLSSIYENRITEVSGPGYINWDIVLPNNFPIQLSDFVIVISKDNIQLSEYSKSSYCLFYSEKKIEIRGQHQSQFFANKINNSSDTLYYPTILASIPGNIPDFIIGGCIQGSIIQFKSQKNSPVYSNQLRWKTNASVHGSVISFFSMDPKITINGGLFIQSTYFYESPAHFRNWIVGTTVNFDDKYSLFPFNNFENVSPEILYAN